jgi:hypothetical protein
VRRNENALKSIVGRQPSLLGNGGTIMRSRKGWKRRDDNNDNNDNK